MSDDSSNRTDVSTIHLDNISLQNRENVDESRSNFLGFDLSTQQLKAIVIDDSLRVRHRVEVDFDRELSEYKTRGGVHRAADGSQAATAPVNMWLKALDLCLDKLRVEGLDFGSVLAVSGCAQQHGSVWWRRESGQLLARLNASEFLHTELQAAFTLRDAPIWMDSSTGLQCRRLERRVGGPARMAALTGSRAFERFTAAQIAKVLGERRELYQLTERITLVSNFLASLFCGFYAPLDAADASGMNLMELHSKRWSEECLRATLRAAEQADGDDDDDDENLPENLPGKEPPGGRHERDHEDELSGELAGLRARLGCSGSNNLAGDNIVDSHEVLGRVSRYFVDRFNFPPECLVSSFTGDNPASLAGLCARPDELVLSLGTSDTALFWLHKPRPGLTGHVMRNPLDERAFMGLVCFKNGSRTRERLRDQHANGLWPDFERLLAASPPGNLANLGFFHDLREIWPPIAGDFRFDKLDRRVDTLGAPELEVRACLEGQLMRLLRHSRLLGLQLTSVRRLLITGGASSNRAILQVAADIFQRPVYVLESGANSACLGAAYLAKFAYELEQQKLDQSFSQTAQSLAPDQLAPSERPIDFSAMVLGSAAARSEHEHEHEHELEHQHEEREHENYHHDHDHDHAREGPVRLVRAAEPSPLGDLYEALLERQARLEREIALNNCGEIEANDGGQPQSAAPEGAAH